MSTIALHKSIRYYKIVKDVNMSIYYVFTDHAIYICFFFFKKKV